MFSKSFNEAVITALFLTFWSIEVHVTVKGEYNFGLYEASLRKEMYIFFLEGNKSLTKKIVIDNLIPLVIFYW